MKKLKISMHLVSKMDCNWGLSCCNCEKRLEPKKGVRFDKYNFHLCANCVDTVFDVIKAALEKADV